MIIRHSDLEIAVFNNTDFRYLPKQKIKNTIERTMAGEKIGKAIINVILVDDDGIRELNARYLNHDYATDVIAFPLEENEIVGDIYISVETARENAGLFKVTLTNELLRLACHGALHLAGYDDKTKKQKELMHELESGYIYAD